MQVLWRSGETSSRVALHSLGRPYVQPVYTLFPVGLGIALGVAARLVDAVAPRWVGNIGAIWFLAAFLAGRTREQRQSGGIAGSLCLATACLTYYAWRVVVDGTISVRYLSTIGLLWLIASLLTGGIGGALGAWSRTSSFPRGVTAGVLAGEAVAVLALSHRLAQPLIELTAAALVLTRTHVKQTIAPATATAITVGLAATLYRVLLR